MVSLVIIALMVVSCQAFCPVRLPQHEPWWSPCKGARGVELHVKRAVYRIKKATPEMPFNRLDKSMPEYMLFLATNPFLAAHSTLWVSQAGVVAAGQVAYNVAHLHSPQIMTMKEYADMRNFFRNHVSSPLNLIRGFMKYASDHEPFQSDYTKYISDKFFGEQRLAGMNPMTIRKITFSKKVGMSYDKLKTMLNPKFNFVEAVNRVLGGIRDEASLRKAIEDGRLFVLYHSFSSGLGTMRDLTGGDRERKMWKYTSPIAIFASKKVNSGLKLMPVAIQMNDKQDAQVFTPKDGDNWMLAKLDVQLTDLGCSQIVEHLTKVHFVSEEICLSLERQLSHQHPLYDIMRFHCRGIFTANTIGGPVLSTEKLSLDKLMPYGHLGVKQLIKKAGNLIDWNDFDLRNNLKRRGVDDKANLPYYPYRDDGIVIADVLNKFVTDYVNSFYKSDKDVRKDEELQRFAKEIVIRGFPNDFRSKASLTETFTRTLWLLVGQHTAINYPMSDYATYVPDESTKLYDDKRVRNNKFSPARMNNRKTASEQMALVLSLSSFRFDRLFDYGFWLRTSKGKHVVNYYRHKLAVDIEPVLKKRNKDRKNQGHLTYPYMQPSWLTNGIQA